MLVVMMVVIVMVTVMTVPRFVNVHNLWCVVVIVFVAVVPVIAIGPMHMWCVRMLVCRHIGAGVAAHGGY